jgi:ribonucleoside-diphosphate reductase beta chain
MNLSLSLYHKAKSLMWDPRDIDLTQDKADWAKLNSQERALLIALSARFLGGEKAVTHDLAPLLVATRRRNQHDDLLADEMFLTAQLFEESKHVEWFDRLWAEVYQMPPDTSSAVGDAYHTLFYQQLPDHLNALLGDTSDPAIVRAISTYHMIIEGVLAETGYHGYKRALQANGLMPGTVRGVELVQRDEARHIAYGLDRLQRLFARDANLRHVMDDTLNAQLPLTLEIIADIFAPFADDVPFGIQLSEFVEYASDQFAARMNALERD